MNFIKKIFQNPLKALRYLRFAVKKRVSRSNDLLVMVGARPYGEVDLLYYRYKSCLIFEANPARYKKLKEKFGSKQNIKVHNYAVADYDGEIELNISSNSAESSSVGKFDESWLKSQSHSNIKMEKSVKVPCINLFNFLKQKNITYIGYYISDIQGMDLQVLKTLRPMIEQKQIGTIKCEVTKDKYRNIYYDLPDNSESGFGKLLQDNYELVAKGQGLLLENKFDKISDEAWEMDCKWTAK